MIEVICAAISAAATIICAWLAREHTRQFKQTEQRAIQRAKEGRLQLAMIAANTDLTIGIAMALKNGKCNGEVEEGLKKVKESQVEYRHFLEGLALDNINEGRF